MRGGDPVVSMDTRKRESGGGIRQRRAGGTQDLVKLYAGLPDEVKRIVESIASSEGVLPPVTILEKTP